MNEKFILPNVTKEGEVMEDPPLDSHNHNPPNIPDYDKVKEVLEEVIMMNMLMMRKEEMLQKRKKWKEELGKVIIEKETVTNKK